MKRFSLLLALAFLAPRFGAAAPASPVFGHLRSLASGGQGIVPVKYRTEQGPGWEDPRRRSGPPPNLKLEQASGLIRKMVELETQRSGTATLTKEQAQRLGFRMLQIDRDFVDSIPGTKWDAIIAKMSGVAEAELDKPGHSWDDTVDKMLKTAVGELKDPHSGFMTKEEFKNMQDQMQGSYSGIGAQLAKKDNGAEIDLVFPNSPAERAGVQEGDIITAVDGTPMAGKELNEVVLRVLGKEGTPVKLSIERGGKALPQPITVTRGAVTRNNAFSKMLGASIGYVYFSDFSQDEIDETVFNHIDKLRAQGARKLVIDVRANPGGRVDYVASIASEFLKDGQDIVAFKKQGKVTEKEITDGDGKYSDMKVVVLVNGYSASASEILAGALQDHTADPAVIGSRSYGKGTAQAITPSPDGRALRLTGSRWYTPADRTISADHDADGQKIKGTGGVVPDIIIDLPEEEERKLMGQIMREINGGAPKGPKVADRALEKALEILGGPAS